MKTIKILLAVFFMTPFSAFSQSKGSGNVTYRTGNLVYGWQTMKLDALNTSLFGNSGVAFNNSLTIFSENQDVFPFQKAGVMNLFQFTWIDQQKISYFDTAYTLGGYHLHILHMGFDAFPANKYVDWNFFGGLEYGRLKLTKDIITGSSAETVFTNPLFGFDVSSDLHFNVFPFRNKQKGFGFGGRAGYNFDLSNPKWIVKSGSGTAPANVRLSSYYFGALLVFYL